MCYCLSLSFWPCRISLAPPISVAQSVQSQSSITRLNGVLCRCPVFPLAIFRGPRCNQQSVRHFWCGIFANHVVSYPFCIPSHSLTGPGLTVWGSSERFVSTGINPWQVRCKSRMKKKLCSGKWGGSEARLESHAVREACCKHRKSPEVASPLNQNKFCVHCFGCISISSSSIRVKISPCSFPNELARIKVIHARDSNLR